MPGASWCCLQAEQNNIPLNVNHLLWNEVGCRVHHVVASKVEKHISTQNENHLTQNNICCIHYCSHGRQLFTHTPPLHQLLLCTILHLFIFVMQNIMMSDDRL